MSEEALVLDVAAPSGSRGQTDATDGSPSDGVGPAESIPTGPVAETRPGGGDLAKSIPRDPLAGIAASEVREHADRALREGDRRRWRLRHEIAELMALDAVLASPLVAVPKAARIVESVRARVDAVCGVPPAEHARFLFRAFDQAVIDACSMVQIERWEVDAEKGAGSTENVPGEIAGYVFELLVEKIAVEFHGVDESKRKLIEGAFRAWTSNSSRGKSRGVTSRYEGMRLVFQSLGVMMAGGAGWSDQEAVKKAYINARDADESWPLWKQADVEERDERRRRALADSKT